MLVGNESIIQMSLVMLAINFVEGILQVLVRGRGYGQRSCALDEMLTATDVRA